MAFHSAQDARIYVGILSAAAYARTVSVESPTDMLNVTTLADRAKVFIPSLTDGGTFSIAGPLDVDASSNGQYDALTDLKAATDGTPITYLPTGASERCWLFDALQTQFQTMSTPTSSVDWMMSAVCDGQVDFDGVVLENNTTVTTDTDGTANNNGAGTTNGAVFHLHVTAYSGLTSDAITVEGSTTGSFAGEETTVATFTTVTGLTSQRLAVTGTVPRYLRVVDDVTGTGSITRFVAVSRR